MSIPRPEHFQDWKSWAAELIRRDAADPLAARVAKLLGTQGGISAEYIRQKDVIQLTSSDSFFATDVVGLDDFISDEIGGLLIEGAGIDLAQDSVTGAITIAATGGGVAVHDEGTTLTSSAGFLDFKGAGVTATTVSGGVEVSIPGAGASAFRGALVYRTSDQSFSASTWTCAIWQAASYDTDSLWSSGNPKRLTVPSGVTKVRLSGQMSCSSASSHLLAIRKNQSTDGAQASYTGIGLTALQTPWYDMTQVFTPVLSVTPGDYFDLIIIASASGDIYSSESWFAMEVIA